MANPRPIPILVLCGQSNANNTDIIRASFDRAAAMGGMLVHLAVNGSPLAAGLDQGGGDWSAASTSGAGELFRGLVAQVAAILDPNSASYVPGAYLEGMIWVHGGADIYTRSAATNYGANLTALRDAMVAQFGQHQMVIAAMADASFANRTLTPYQADNWRMVQAAQSALAASAAGVSLVDPDAVAAVGGFSASQMFRSDYIHYDSTHGYAAALGRALATAAMPGQTPASAGLVYRAGTSGDDSFALTAKGFAQVWAGAGVDRVALVDDGIGVTLVAMGLNEVRIQRPGSVQPIVLDLIAVEQVSLGSGNDKVRLGGGMHWINAGSGRDTVNGSALGDTILLGAGYDLAYGGDGADRIDGSWGNDSLFGGAGNDRLSGGTANNTLSGGVGADYFVFVNNPGIDLVTDFQHRTDKLVFRDIDWADVVIRYASGRAVIDAGDREVILLNQTAGSVTQADFLFL